MSLDNVGDGKPKSEGAPKHPKVIEKHPKVIAKPAESHPKVVDSHPKVMPKAAPEAPPHPKVAAAARPKAPSSGPPEAAEPRRRWLEGPARHALMAALGIVVAVNLALTYVKVTKRPAVVDTGVRLRDA